MSGYNNNWSEDDDFENEVASHGGGGLRKLLEESLAENKKLRERLEKQDREKSATVVFEDSGLDPALVELIPDGMTATEYVEKFGHLLGVKSQQSAVTETKEVNVQVPEDEDDAVVARRAELAAEEAARKAMRDAQDEGSPAVFASLEEQMNKIDNEDDLMKFFNSNGTVHGS